jgi:hypothetical protein
MQRKIMASFGMLLLAFVVVACSGAATPAAAPTAPADAPVAVEAPVATEAPKTDAAPSSGAIEVPVQTPFACPEGTATDASGALLVSGCESISDIQTKYPGMNVLPNSVMMEYSAEGTREGYYDDTITSGLTDLPTMCKFLQFYGDIYNGDQASLTAIGTGVDMLGAICATDNEYIQVAVSDSLKTVATTSLGLAADDKIFAYETSTGLGYYVFWKMDPADNSRVVVSIISGALSSQ